MGKQTSTAEATERGISEAKVGKMLSEGANALRTRGQAWSEGYARMAFRTNANTATTLGRFRQARDPDVREVVPAMVYDAVGDSDTRENHADRWQGTSGRRWRR